MEMNGFLLMVSSEGYDTPHISKNVTLYADESENHNFGPNVELLSWRKSGDVYSSTDRDNSLLLLSGYISDGENLEEFGCQQSIADNLRQQLDHTPTLERLRQIANGLNGSFSIAYVSLKERILLSCTDRICSRPLWYYISKERLIISTNAISIAKAQNLGSFAPGRLISYFLYGSQIEPHTTLFSEITSQPEGTLWKIALDSPLKVNDVKWYSYKHEPLEDAPLSFWTNLCTEKCLAAVEKLLKTTETPLLFLSGGVDSRLVGSALCAIGGKPLLCTLADSYNLEIKVSKIVAKALGVPQEILIRDDEWYLRMVTEGVFSSNGNFSWTHSHFSSAFTRMQKNYGVDAAILGDLAEAFSKLCFVFDDKKKDIWSPEEFAAEFDRLPLPNYRPVNRELSLGLLKDDFRNQAELELKDSILRRYREVSCVSSDRGIVGDSFFRWKNVSSIATFQMFNDVRSAGRERNLMFDNDMLRLLEIMPAKVRNGNNLGAKIIGKLFKKAGYAPDANSLMPLVLPVPFHSLAKSARPVLGKIKRRLFSNTYETTASWPHLPLLYSGNPSWRKRIEEQILDGSMLSNEIFDSEKVEKCWSDFCNGELELFSDIESLIGLSELEKILSLE